MKDIELSDAQLDKIAELASEKSMAKFHQAVGKSVIKKGFWLAAAVGVAILVFLQEGIQKGAIHYLITVKKIDPQLILN